jgi:hypothetical protein
MTKDQRTALDDLLWRCGWLPIIEHLHEESLSVFGERSDVATQLEVVAAAVAARIDQLTGSGRA